MKEQIEQIINEVVADRIGYFPDQEGLLEEIATRLDKAIGIDSSSILEMLNKNEYWAGTKEVQDALHVEKKLCNYDLAQAITQSRPLKCEVVEYAQPCNHRPDCTCQYCD